MPGRDTIESYKPTWMGSSGQSLKDHNADRNINSLNPGAGGFNSEWTSLALSKISYILHLSICPCPETLLKIVLRNSRLRSLIFRLWHGFFWLQLARSTVRIIKIKRDT